MKINYEIEKHFKKYFPNICDPFVDIKLSIHFADSKTKLIRSASKSKRKNSKKTQNKIC